MIIYIENKKDLTEEQIEKIKLILDYEHNASTIVVRELFDLSRSLDFKFSIELRSLKDILHNLSKEEIDILNSRKYNIKELLSYKNKNKGFDEYIYSFLGSPNFNIKSLNPIKQSAYSHFKYAISKNNNEYAIVNHESINDVSLDENIFDAFNFKNKNLLNNI